MQPPSLLRKIIKAVAHPGRLLGYIRRRIRNATLPRADHYEFYRHVVDDNAARDPDRAIGSDSREQWLALGEFQFQFLQSHGLATNQRFLDVGCGNLRLGWRVIQFLEPEKYCGLDLSPVILDAARRTVAEFALEPKKPTLHLVENADYQFLPADSFDIAYAHAVFTQTPLAVVLDVLSSVARVIKPGGFFEFTYNPTDGEERNYLNEDFFFRRETILGAVSGAGLVPEEMHDWHYNQKKIRAHKLAQ